MRRSFFRFSLGVALMLVGGAVACQEVAATPLPTADLVVDVDGREVRETNASPAVALWYVAGPEAAPAPSAKPTPPAPPPPPPLVEAEPASWAAWMLDRVRAGDWTAVTGGVLTLLALLIRVGLVRIHPWFATRPGGVVVSLSSAFAGIFGLALAAGGTPSLALALTAIGAAAAASGLWSWLAGMWPWLADIVKPRPASP